MSLNITFLKTFPFVEHRQTYSERDTILYALGVGLGADPMDERQLKFVHERRLVAMPSMVNVLSTPGHWVTHPDAGITWTHTLHGEQHVEFHNQLPPAGSVVARTEVEDIVDKGKDKGALIYTRRTLTNLVDMKPLATVRQTLVCRADGGFASVQGAARPVHHVPEGTPESTCSSPTIPQLALVYRLSGDRNPLHVSPSDARTAGFARPILHGLCTFGIATHAVLRQFLDYDSSRLRSLQLRFTSPVYPGETIRTEFWRTSATHISFRCRALEREKVVVDNGLATIS